MKEPHEYWYVAYTRSCQDRNVADALTRAGYECYFAVQTVLHKWSDRVKKIQKPVIPRVVFVRCTEEQRRDSLKAFPYIVKYLSKGEGAYAPAIVPDDQIALFRSMVEGGSEVKITPSSVKPGDMVRIKSGPLAGKEAEICEIDGNTCIMARLAILGTATIKIDRDNIELIQNTTHETR